MFAVNFSGSSPSRICIARLLGAARGGTGLVITTVLTCAKEASRANGNDVDVRPSVLQPVVRRVVQRRMEGMLRKRSISGVGERVPARISLVRRRPLQVSRAVERGMISTVDTFHETWGDEESARTCNDMLSYSLCRGKGERGARELFASCSRVIFMWYMSSRKCKETLA